MSPAHIAIVALAVLGYAVHQGSVRIPLPFPAAGKYVEKVPSSVYPWHARSLEGPLSPNSHLTKVTRLFEGSIQGSESVTIAADGHLVMLDKYGYVHEATEGKHGQFELSKQPVAYVGPGRPLGAQFDTDGNLIICDSLKGLMMLEKDTHRVLIVANRVSDTSAIDPGSEILYANDLDIASDGTIYFTASTNIVPHRNEQGFFDTFRAWQLGMCQGAPAGKLLSYNPKTKEVHVLAKDFYYANGVALSADESYLVMVETDRIRTIKFWLKGEKAGSWEVLYDRLPGAPDGVSRASDGNFWVALLSPIPPVAKVLGPPAVRGLYAWLPAWLRPPLKSWGAVVKISLDGQVVDFLLDITGEHVSKISSAHEHDGRLYLGNLVTDYVSFLDLRELKKSRSNATATT
eukprot:jgi/Chrzof1/8792/Cz03g24210.t1